MGAILLLTANSGTMTGLSSMLIKRGYDVVGRTDAASALSAVQDGPELDAVIADYVLPDMDTPHFFSTLKKAASRPIPVIFMNDYVDVQGYLDILSLGAFDFLFKPVDPGELFRILKVAVNTQPERGRHETKTALFPAFRSGPVEKPRPLFRFP